jgi:hypothetical protein
MTWLYMLKEYIMSKTEMRNNAATPRAQTEDVLRELGWSTTTCREDTVQAWKSEVSDLTFFVDEREIWVDLNVTVTPEQTIWMDGGEAVGMEGTVSQVNWSKLHPTNPIWVSRLHKMVGASENVMEGAGS